MKKILMYKMLVVAAMAMVCLLHGSCGNTAQRMGGARHRVVVVHSWDSVGEERGLFSSLMERAFEKQGMAVEVHHLYANMVRRPVDVFDQYDAEAMVEKIKRLKPEVILMNDDPIMEWLLTREKPDSVFVNTPVVFAGVNALPREKLSKFPQMTGFEARIDLGQNIDEVMRIGKGQCVVLELDYDDADERLRTQFEEELRDSTRYVNNADFHVLNLDEEYLKKNFQGLAVVSMVSCAHPYMNRGEDGTDAEGKAITGMFYQKARTMWHLQVKHDIFSGSLMNHAGGPQFTCIREGFGDATDGKFIGGYFTGTDIQVDDEVRYAVRIIRGETPKSLPIGMHACDYYMDWNAVREVFPHVPYGQYSGKFKMVNVPFYLENPLQFVGVVALIVVLVSVLIYIIVFFMFRWRERGQRLLMEELLYEEKVHDLMFANAKDTFWEYNDGVFTISPQFAEHFKLSTNRLTMEELSAMVHEDSRAAFEFLLKFPEQRGKKTVRLHLSPDGGKSWYWGEVTYTATDESAREGRLYGLLINIDRKKETEEQLERAQQLASEVALKENFLANISHDLRTPLGAVTGFSTLLTTPGMTFEEGEREQYGEIIHQNTDMILSMIDSVMQKAQIETGDLEVIQKPVSVRKLVEDCYNTNQIIAPTHLDFRLEMAEGDVTVNIDMTRTKQVVNNFLSNAFKFTMEGSVTLGWKYVEDDNDQIEVYVKDTGIGVAPEKQAMLFERYKKVNETDRGTGLGLNISKTIIEKQGGSIGVESKQGEGSKFFFRLRRYVECLLLLLVVGTGLVMPTSCRSRAKETKRAKVLVFHSYGSDFPSYKKFNECLRESFIEHGVNADLRHVYLNLENPGTDTEDVHLWAQDSLRDNGWKPDIVLTEGDRATTDLLRWQARGMIDELDSVPMVLGGVHHPDWETVRRHPNMVVISDPIDYCTNINLAVEITGKNCVEVELDYFHQDSLIRKELRAAIARPPYMDNSDFHAEVTGDEQFSTVWKDSVMVLVYSTESPERNSRNLYRRDAGYQNLRRIYTHAWLYPSVSVKRDLYSSSIADKTGRPQFTAVKAGFADGEGKYLCGYFAGYETVGEDMARVASELIYGADPSALVGLTHEKDYYMDYQAMKMLDMDYDDYKDRFTIVGAPMEVRMPLMVYATWTVIVAIFLLAIYVLVLVLMNWRTRTVKGLMASVKRRAEMRNMALHGADSRNVRSEAEVRAFVGCVHPDHATEVPLIMQATGIEGTHFYELYADVERDGLYRWWQLRFVVMVDEKTRRKNVEGILINIDETKKYEADLRKAMVLAEEARQKEDFLTTISHEIRTPLNAVVGFSDVMVSMPPESFSPEELAEYAKIIKSNNNSLTAMIENILMFSRIESGRIQYVMGDFDAAELTAAVAAGWRDLMPDQTELHVFAVQQGIVVNNDRERMKYILDQLMSNAVKFTERGVIILGIIYHLNSDEVEFFVTDTGCGIPKEKQNIAFGLFWKDNGFVPGLGLGLNVVKKMAEGMGLRLAVESQPGAGSRFSVFAKGRISDNSQLLTSNS